MFTVEEWLGEGEISLDGHYESHTAGAHAEEAPDNANEAEEPNVVLVEAWVGVGCHGHLRQHSQQAHKLQRH